MQLSGSRFVRKQAANVGVLAVGFLLAGGFGIAHAGGSTPSPSNVASSFTPITPCRVIDTRTGAPIGPHVGPFTAGETATLTMAGTNGNCTIPNTATAIAANVTVLDGTVTSYLTMWPADVATPPNASTNNWTGGSAPLPNQIDVKLSPIGQIKVRNDAGTVNVLIDIVGYYDPAGTDIAILSKPQTIVASTFGTLGTPPCPVGQMAVGGGLDPALPDQTASAAFKINGSFPVPSVRGWAVNFYNVEGPALSATLWTVCATPKPG
jgi:hypothetical protein